MPTQSRQWWEGYASAVAWQKSKSWGVAIRVVDTNCPSLSSLHHASLLLLSCNKDETRAMTPGGLQEALDVLMASSAVAPYGRVFVRPSGTEDVVRVYAGKV